MSVSMSEGIVVDNVDNTGKGYIKVLVSSLDPDRLFVAKPVVLPLSGNERIESSEAHQGSFMVPPKGAHVLLLYEVQGATVQMYYIGCVHPESDKPLLPEAGLKEPEKRYTIRTASGQSVVFSEATGERYIRITGKKRKYSRDNPTESVTPIKGNQSVIEINGQNDSVYIYSLESITLETDGGVFILDKKGNLTIRVNGQISVQAPRIVEKAFASRTNCTCRGKATFSHRADIADRCR